MAYLGLILSLDGTLFDSAPQVTGALRAALQATYPEALPFVSEHVLDTPLKEVLSGLGVSENAVVQVERQYHEVYEARASTTRTFPGVVRSLKELHEGGALLTIATGRHQSEAERLVRLHRLDPLINLVVGADNSTTTNKEDAIRQCANFLDGRGVSHQDMWVIGDRASDISAARAVGVGVVFAGWGYGASGESEGSFRTLNRPDQLPDILFPENSHEPRHSTNQLWTVRASQSLKDAGFDFPNPRPAEPTRVVDNLYDLSAARLSAINEIVMAVIQTEPEAVERFVKLLAEWMFDRAPVRVLGAGRARLAAAIPANRLSHGGARVYLQDADMPMPHSLHGGGILAASASGRTRSVLEALGAARRKNRDVTILGVAAREANDFGALCDVFLPLDRLEPSREPRLTALADLQEQAISQLLDILVVAAGRRLGYTDATWRLGHEDLGATGPYDHSGDSQNAHYRS